MVILFTILVALVLYFLKTSICEAHCDTMDGPVVQAAQKALETKNINLILIWIPPENEAEIQDIFQKTLNIRELSPEARELADRLFFETLVRLHRAGEGAPFTGLKPAGSESSPAIQAADQAIHTGEIQNLLEQITDIVVQGIKKHFQQVKVHRDFPSDDIPAGRKYIASYVEFIHYVERIFKAASASAPGHFHEE